MWLFMKLVLMVFFGKLRVIEHEVTPPVPRHAHGLTPASTFTRRPG